MDVQSPAVEFSDVSLRLGKTRVLEGVSFRLEQGEILVLLGRSGAGKSSALRLVNRLLEVDEGQVRVRGRPVRDWDSIQLRRETGYVIQEVGLFPHFTVGQNVALVPELQGWEEGRIRRRVRELLETVGLPPDGFVERYPASLSGGQRQRVGVARALAAEPPLLLCDEPFGALDPITRRELQSEFGALSRRLGKSLLFVTHDVAEAMALGDRIALLEEGRLVFTGPPEEFRRSEHPMVRAFLGDGERPVRAGGSDGGPEEAPG